MNTMLYTYEKINTIKAENTFSLDEEILNIILELDKLIGVDTSIDKIPLKRNDRSFDKKGKNKRGGYKMSRSSSSMSDMTIDDWETIRNFKPTEKTEINDFDKKFNEIRSDLNKLSKAKFNEIKDVIIQKIVYMLDEPDLSVENQTKIGDTIFNICSNNRFLSELYSELYVELVGQFDMFGNILDSYINRFKDSLDNIKYIDPDENYDGFCEYNRDNEERKSHSVFLINLMKQDMISKKSILELINNLQNISLKYIDEENKTHEVEEITENIFLLVNNSKSTLENCTEWEKIIQNINHFSTLKAKEHTSLSSRCVFKYMDMK